MSLYIQQLKAATEAAQRRHEDKAKINRRSEVEAVRERRTSLDERLRRLLATVPIDLQREGLSLPALQATLRGRRGRACSSGELGTALRRLGWSRTRSWRGGESGGFSALWHPPSAI